MKIRESVLKKLYSRPRHLAALCQLSYITVIEDLLEFSIAGCREDARGEGPHWSTEPGKYRAYSITEPAL